MFVYMIQDTIYKSIIDVFGIKHLKKIFYIYLQKEAHKVGE